MYIPRFLLQDDSRSILYTGDFRLQAEDIKHTPTLHPRGRCGLIRIIRESRYRVIVG